MKNHKDSSQNVKDSSMSFFQGFSTSTPLPDIDEPVDEPVRFEPVSYDHRPARRIRPCPEAWLDPKYDFGEASSSSLSHSSSSPAIFQQPVAPSHPTNIPAVYQESTAPSHSSNIPTAFHELTAPSHSMGNSHVYPEPPAESPSMSVRLAYPEPPHSTNITAVAYQEPTVPVAERNSSAQYAAVSGPPLRSRSSMPPLRDSASSSRGQQRKSESDFKPTGRGHHHNAETEFAPTFRGVVHSTHDALLIIEACLQGKLHHVPRRPHDKERTDMIKSGSIFVYEENASGIKRWTDGLTWSPSRIMGNFLVYRELDKPFPPGEKKRAVKRKRTEDDVKTEPKPSPPVEEQASKNGQSPNNFAASLSADDQRRLCGSLVDSYGFKEGGLIKKTLSIRFKQATHHLISYYTLEDVVDSSLGRPIFDKSLTGVFIRRELVDEQHFRSNVQDDMEQQHLAYPDISNQLQYGHPHVFTPAFTFGQEQQGPRDSVFEPVFEVPIAHHPHPHAHQQQNQHQTPHQNQVQYQNQHQQQNQHQHQSQQHQHQSQQHQHQSQQHQHQNQHQHPHSHPHPHPHPQQYSPQYVQQPVSHIVQQPAELHPYLYHGLPGTYNAEDIIFHPPSQENGFGPTHHENSFHPAPLENGYGN